MIRHALPSQRVTNADLADAHGFDDRFIEEKLGVSERFRLAEGETVSQLASTAVKRLLTDSGVAPKSVDVLAVVTQTPDYSLPHVAALVQDEASLPQTSLTLDINLGCSGYVIGLATILSLMESHGLEVGVLVTVDAYSRILDLDDRNTAPLFGDAATATLLSTEPRYRVGRFTFGSDGSQSEALIAHGSGSTREARQPLFMDGRAIFNFAVREIPNDLQRCLALNSVSMSEVEKVVFHQANKFVISAIAKRCGISDEQLVISLKHVGNTTSSSIPLALEKEILSGERLPNTVLISGFGVGLSWASTLLVAHSVE